MIHRPLMYLRNIHERSEVDVPGLRPVVDYCPLVVRHVVKDTSFGNRLVSQCKKVARTEIRLRRNRMDLSKESLLRSVKRKLHT